MDKKQGRSPILHLLALIFVLWISADLSGTLSHAYAEENFKLQFPLACDHGRNCWIYNYMDVNTSLGLFEDFTCAKRTYDGHEGIDIALKDLATASQGAWVVAAADGKISTVIDGIKDHKLDETTIDLAHQFPCGNTVVIDHKSGWQTTYCHLKLGSIVVRPGDKVKAGRALAQVGLSGLTGWPHLGFTLKRDDITHDPFTGRTALEGCGFSQNNSLWDKPEEYNYQPFAIFNIGFSAEAPEKEALDQGFSATKELSTETPILTLWGYVLGTKPGDRVLMEIEDPEGYKMIDVDNVVPNSRKRRLVTISRMRFNEVWKPGLYKGKITLIRKVGAEDKETAWGTGIYLVEPE